MGRGGTERLRREIRIRRVFAQFHDDLIGNVILVEGDQLIDEVGIT